MRSVLIVAFLVVSSPALAQTKMDKPTARAASEALIAKADAGGIFTPGAWEWGPTARHARSGMLCLFASNASANSITINDPKPSRGDDVNCRTIVGGAIFSHFASRASLVGGYPNVVAMAPQALKARLGDVKPYSGKTFDLPAKEMPPLHIERFVTDQRGALLYERVAVMDMGDWVITQRVTAPIASGPAADRLAGINLGAIAASMRSQ
ncbi:hypothetical protein [Phenylobacterium sp.]|uniref:hypothetical protein n=1 Tax=Phenylobacterium sp. TaxID=1871053 RepID=UPI00273123C3|nr:hypothetical protein [Phenylobacterium sp.]MDP1598472.1 hypothetical protein [Phenylobacterium sp.]MDP3591344.1 hypothetical protein [Phenylobacterium sp.]